MIKEILNDVKKGVILKRLKLDEKYFFELQKTISDFVVAVFEEDRLSVKENLGKTAILFSVAGVINDCTFENIYDDFYKVIIPEEKELLSITNKNDVTNLINMEITDIYKDLNLSFKITDEDIVNIYHYLFLISKFYNFDFEKAVLEAIS
ncbi:hypothetical protein [Parvimonas parva]|uniref:Uncharacterized protein n=1 Tax=Parvimonas parva TaxID=2769485 RepID=A0ABS1C954_9FIRM|nr:hypothetical protein [Parvimonas parva]MBK1468642.1 hypothetical protein [Parvimonas parva]